jgi:outer membrane protein OmpA-like peptidoglycan-associated protein/tetratricopeptide (TPR) repeat protein
MMKSISNRFLLCIGACLMVISTVIGQSPTKKQFIETAEKEYADKNFYWALIHYNEALEFDKNDPVVLFKSAEAARQFNAYARAAEKYQYLIDSLRDNTQPVAIYWLAKMKQNTGKYDEARKYYDIYMSEYGNTDTLFTAKTKKELASIDYAQSLTKNPKKNIRLEKLGEDINSPSSEVAGNVINDEFYFSSMKYKEANPLTLPSRDISKLLKKSKDSITAVIPGYINERDQLISNAAINSNGTMIYYTVCNYINGSELSCEIFRSNFDVNGQLSNEVKLPEPINLTGTTSTHPHLAIDKSSGKEILYFVSNRQGGAGGLDIWYSLIDPKFGFSEPVNISQINTADNEITPYYHKVSDFLYFSSDGREGLGGYDIYKAGRINNEFGGVINGGYPLNSSYHDLYYYEKEDGGTAYFSSNREGSFFLDSYFESCCYDIYKLDIIKLDLDLNALTFDKLTGRSLKKATVILIDQDTGQELVRFKNDEGNDHKFPLSEDRNYLIIAERENYYPDTITLSTIGVEKSESFVRKMYLSTDMMLLDVFTFTKVGKFPLEGTTVTLIDMSDQQVKDIVELNPLSNEFNFMLDRGKMYKIIARKEGYTDAEEIIDTRPYDKSGLITKELYLDKFVLQDLLPITLFFDNDLPDVASRSTTTKAKYGNLVNKYISRKEEYKQKFAKPLPVNKRDAYNDDYETFFEGDVKGGYDKFKLFINNLLQELEAGNKVELILKGFTSPRAESKYNLTLGQRRVNSVKNELIFFDNEELKSYFLSGQLVITDISFGKELAPPDVDDNIKDERNSIYNLKAAKERRVEILRASRNTLDKRKTQGNGK